ncbi:MAG: hypothetical protein SGPRY_003793 [Prymnesium sp.]
MEVQASNPCFPHTSYPISYSLGCSAAAQDASGFREKNQDDEEASHIELLSRSRHRLVGQLLSVESSSREGWSKEGGSGRTDSGGDTRPPSLRSQRRRQPSTIGGHFMRQLNQVRPLGLWSGGIMQ